MRALRIVVVSAFIILLSSCSSLKKHVDNSDRVILTEDNLTLLNGRYKRKSMKKNTDSLQGDLYVNLLGNTYSFVFDKNEGLDLNGDADFIELKVMSKKRILVSYINGNDTLSSKILKGKLKDGYFEFRRNHFFFTVILATVYRDSKFRIGVLGRNLITDYQTTTSGALYLIVPIYDKKNEPNVIFERIEDEPINNKIKNNDI